MKIKVEIEVTDEQIDDLLTSAFEGGSNYWYTIDNIKTPFRGAAGEAWRKTNEGILVIDKEAESDDDEVLGDYLNRQKVKKGLQLMAEKYPTHWNNFINDNGDADTGDIFLQLCLFGSVVFGQETKAMAIALYYLKKHWEEFDLWLFKHFDYGLFELRDSILDLFM